MEDMEMQKQGEEGVDEVAVENEKITPWYLLTLIKPILADELIAQLRFDRAGLRVKFCNGQKFRIRIEEL